jgi:choline dehydrogenase-like flavoprotein
MTEFDYVIVGGGLAGLVLAARLSEKPDVTVCVIEAGKDVSSLENIRVPGELAVLSFNSI